MVFFFDEGTFASAAVSSYNNCLYPVEDGSYDYLCVVWDDVSIDSSEKYGAGQLAELQSDSGREAGSITADPGFSQELYPGPFPPRRHALIGAVRDFEVRFTEEITSAGGGNRGAPVPLSA